jgi:hypothetical protein
MHDAPGPGHNARRPAQWQTPHRAGGAGAGEPARAAEPDVDLVEASFREGFRAASDPVSFLRLAGIPLALRLADGRAAHLLRVEEDECTDVGAVSPGLGGGHVVRPLPAKLVARRRRLRFVYQADDDAPATLTFAEARAAQPIEP